MVVVLLAIMIMPALARAAQTDPGSEPPTNPSIAVIIERACITPAGGAHPEGGPFYNGSFSGRTEGPVLNARYTWVEHRTNGSFRVHTWTPRLTLEFITNQFMFATGPDGDEDWTEWEIAWRTLAVFYNARVWPIEDVDKMVLWVRAFEQPDYLSWSQASRVIYTREGGFVCDEPTDFLTPALAVGGASGIAVAAIVWRRRALRGRPSAYKPAQQ